MKRTFESNIIAFSFGIYISFEQFMNISFKTCLFSFSIYNPINYLEGVHKDFSLWMDAMQFETVSHVRIYQARLSALATQVKHVIISYINVLTVGK